MKLDNVDLGGVKKKTTSGELTLDLIIAKLRSFYKIYFPTDYILYLHASIQSKS
jgi:hypothetical protein